MVAAGGAVQCQSLAFSQAMTISYDFDGRGVSITAGQEPAEFEERGTHACDRLASKQFGVGTMASTMSLMVAQSQSRLVLRGRGPL